MSGLDILTALILLIGGSVSIITIRLAIKIWSADPSDYNRRERISVAIKNNAWEEKRTLSESTIDSILR